MNKDMIMCSASSTSSDFQLCPASPDAQEIFRPGIHFSDVCAESVHPITTMEPQQQNPTKKRTKMMRFQNMKAIVGVSSSKPKYGKKPDPSAPKITRPCSECGKRFWSWKALFGHMRCHPERPWRGINPPTSPCNTTPMLMPTDHVDSTTNEDRYVASCLLMLANGGSRREDYEELGDGGLFECSSCKKVFGSHQALGGHRASHKNVKGCFANEGEEGMGDYEYEYEGEKKNVNMVHKCSICLRVFSSGQALGGHKRCHWEKEEEEDDDVVCSEGQCDVGRLDLNLPLQDYSSNLLGLDLRLAL